MKKIILIIGFLLLILPQTSHAARLWSSGFELQSVTTGVEWGTSYDAIAISAATKRSGAASLSCPTGGDYIQFYFSAASPTVDHYFRFYLNIAGYPSTTIGRIFDVRANDGTRTASIKLNTNGTLELWDEDGGITAVQLGSDSSVLQLDTWYRIEVAFDYIGVQDNTITAYIDGVQFATGDDVGGTTADQPIVMYVGAIGSTINGGIFIDDVAINDSTGTVQNSLPGAGSIVYLWPNAAGDTNTCNVGDYTSVDEMTPDDATSYAECDDDNDILDVNMQASSVPGINSYDNITLVQVGVRHVTDTGGSGIISLTPRIMSQSGGTVASGTAFTHDDPTWKSNGDVLPRTYKLISYTNPQDVLNGPWTPALLDTMQIGVTATDATPDAWISTLWALVEYTAGTPPAAAVAATVRVIINNIKMIINGAKMIIP